ncbi:MAG: c-type cytochrome [Boseongicola sp.]|nr:c-type cytochrome [Boseongicola sp.]MDD9977074.1 c-type cytochrome [Boseongicola sp.]
MKRITISLGLLMAFATTPAIGEDGSSHGMQQMMSPGLMLPNMDSRRGRALFAEKGCVVCHSVNDVGGEDAPMLDAEFMDEVMNPFEFAARMWRGAGAMVALQEDEMGGQIDLTGQELADIIAFVHDEKEQMIFSEADIPEEIEEMMHHEGEEDHHEAGEEDDHG